MTEKLMHKYALSRQGAKDMIRACICVTITNMVLMMPAGILYCLIKDLLEGTLTAERIPFYAVGSVAVLLLIAITNFILYKISYCL